MIELLLAIVIAEALLIVGLAFVAWSDGTAAAKVEEELRLERQARARDLRQYEALLEEWSRPMREAEA